MRRIKCQTKGFGRRLLVLIALTSTVTRVSANDTDSIRMDKFRFSGFFKTDMFYDTRQLVGVRQGLLVLYPAGVDRDDMGVDINDRSSLNMLSIHTRLTMNTPVREILKAKVSGVLEADFMGNENSNFADLNGLRVRHAYMSVNWPSTKLLIGQFWHPMFFTHAFPQVISVNVGAPFQPLSRNPQIRVTHSMGKYDLVGTVLSQLDFMSTGPMGQSSSYLRNAGVPNLNLQLHRRSDSTKTFFGLGIDYKSIMPETSIRNEDTGKRTKESALLHSVSLMGVANLDLPGVTWRMASVWAQNPHDILMIGGYAVASTANEPRRYANLSSVSAWTDLQTKGQPLQVGLFSGYTRSLGANQPIQNELYARGANIGSVYRVSPRLQLKFDKLWYSLEYEYTSVAYGRANGDQQGGVVDQQAIANSRLLLSFRYNF